MSSLVEVFAGFRFWLILVFLVGALACFLMLAGSNSSALAGAIGRSVRVTIAAPFGYLRKTIAELCGGDENPRLAYTEHYLLKRFLVCIQILLVLGVILTSGYAVSAGVTVFLPPRHLTQRLDNQQRSLDEATAQANQDAVTVQQENKNWDQRRSELIEESKRQRQQNKLAILAQLKADVATADRAGAAPALQSLRQFLTAHESESGAVDSAKGAILRLPSLDESAGKALLSYCDHWAELQAFSGRRPMTESDIRALVQPNHETLVQKANQDAERRDELAAATNELEAEVSHEYHPGAFVVFVLACLMGLIAEVWACGLAIELFSILIYMSNDLKEINERAKTA